MGEVNTSRFYVERSTDNSSFASVGDLAAAGNTSSIKNYLLQNDISGVLSYPVIYYRVKLVDIDGKTVYSNTVAVRLSAIKSIKVWPNPVADKLTINVYSQINTSMEVRILDVAGKVVMASNYSVVKGNNQVNVENLATIAKGIYMIQLKDKTGTIQYVQKITKE